RGETERLVHDLQEACLRDIDEDLLVEDEDDDHLDDDLMNAAKDYFLVGEDPDGTVPGPLRAAVDASRARRLPDLQAALGLTEPARRALETPLADFHAALQGWFSAARAESDVDGWQHVLKAWRSAL